MNATDRKIPHPSVMLVVESRRRYQANDRATANARIDAARVAHRNARTS